MKTTSYPFWSYIKALTGDLENGLELAENIVLFIPLGYLLRQIGCKKRAIVLYGFIISAAIEIIQLIFHLGFFEIDDILNNTLGAFLGCIIYKKLNLSDVKKTIIVSIVIWGAILYCFTIQKPTNGVVTTEFFFGIKATSLVDGTLTLDGSCFIYEKPQEKYHLVLKSDERITTLSTITGLPSKDINKYYLCNNVYSNTGFRATADINPNVTYEILVKWKNGVTSVTGTYIRDGEIIYSLDEAQNSSAKLLVAEPSHSFYVYQEDNYLYWICGSEFPFESDGMTCIQYQLYTTQPENLPIERRLYDYDWDDISFNFESHEIGSFDGYRVAKCAIPSAYSIKSIETGYYTDGNWIIHDYFRPIVFNMVE